MKNDLNDLKKLTNELMVKGDINDVQEDNKSLIKRIYGEDAKGDDYEDVIDQAYEVTQVDTPSFDTQPQSNFVEPVAQNDRYDFAQEVQEEESLSLMDKEIELIKKSLERHKGKRKAAADDLGISERTLYRKIKQYDL
ncbi:transcriptional regulator [Nonlabens ulvanivorans]|nr:transcriptional regulator [Nonlabens ulvanivorans]